MQLQRTCFRSFPGAIDSPAQSDSMAVNDSDVVQSPVAHAAQGSQDPVPEDHVLVEVDVPGVAVTVLSGFLGAGKTERRLWLVAL